jgi:hypothetical protein
VRRSLALAIVLLAAGEASAHSPATAIGRAVEAFGQVPVSYEPGSVVGEVEAGGFPAIVGRDVKVAFMPATATQEIVGGPDAIAAEIAREADLDGTLIVLVGTKLGAWSGDIDDARLGELVGLADVSQGASPAATVESVVRSVQAEPTGGRAPWGWIAGVSLALCVGSLVVLDRWVRRRP